MAVISMLVAIMKPLHLVLLLFLISCKSNKTTSLTIIEDYYSKLNTGDSTGMFDIFQERIINELGSNYADTFTVQYEVACIIAGPIWESNSYIKSILESNDTMVVLTTNEWPSYLFRKHQLTDTFNYKMTFFFLDNRIYKIRTDTLENVTYCYSCNRDQSDKHIADFFGWLDVTDSTFSNNLKLYYESMQTNPDYYLINTIEFETKQKEYYLKWLNN